MLSILIAFDFINLLISDFELSLLTKAIIADADVSNDIIDRIEFSYQIEAHKGEQWADDLKKLPNKISLFETVIVTVNDYLVELFLNKIITYSQLQNLLLKILNNKSFIKYKKLKPKKFEDIIFVKNNVSSEIVKTIKK